MGVGIGSGHYRVGSGDILFMEFAINMYVLCCFPKWYMQMLCVHWCIVCALASPLFDLFRVITCCVYISVVVFARFSFMRSPDVRLATAHRLAT